MRAPLVLSILAALLCALVATAQDAPPAAEDAAEQARRARVIARVGEARITVGDIEDHIAEQAPFLRERYRDREAMTELVESLVRFELLAREAERRDYDEDPDVREATSQAAVQQLIRRRFDEVITPASMPASDVVAYYEGHPEEFTRPELRRASHVLVATRERADALLLQARAADAAGFRSIAQEQSLDAETRVRGGDLRYFDAQGRSPSAAEAEVHAAIARATFALAEVGDVSDPIEVDGQWSLVKLTGTRPAQHRSLDEAAEPIRLRLWRERRQAAIDELIERLRNELRVETHDELMRSIQMDEPERIAGPDEDGTSDEGEEAPAADPHESE